MPDPIYLDYNATTPIDPEVAKAMLPYLYTHFGNPSSSHPYGMIAKQAVETARSQVAELINCSSAEILFTSGGTESNNFALRGIARANQNSGNHIITTAIEHPAITAVFSWLKSQGFEISILPVDKFGLVNPIDLEKAITPQTTLVSIMHANNEVGTIQPIQALSDITHQQGALFHTDAAQSVGKIEVDVEEMGVDLLSVAGHKVYAPKGVGALYVRKGIRLPNLMFGAGHESGRRPGTENVLQIVGLGKACEIVLRDLKKNQTHFKQVRDQLQNELTTALGDEQIRLNGHPEKRLPNTISLSFKNIAANQLLAEIQTLVAASAGSACHADQVTVSDVLKAMRVPLEWAMGTIRFSVGRGTTAEKINQAGDAIVNAVQKLSAFTPII